jgi:hypothetical protein
MAITAVPCPGHTQLRERPDERALSHSFYMLQSWTMAAFALDIGVYSALDAGVAGGRTLRRVSVSGYRMAALARCRLPRVCLQIRPSVRVFGLAPVSLKVGVTISARRLFRCGVIVAKESRSGSNRLIERFPVPENDLVIRAGKDARREERSHHEAGKSYGR